jgi:pimeloyl-ACP methyl ester carboxylesterase
LSALARDTTAVLDAVSVERAHYCGVSMGGMISQLAAIEHPSRVDKLVLLSTHFGGHGLEPPTPDAMRLFDPMEFLNRGRDPVAMMRFTMSIITAPGFVERSAAALEALLEGVQMQPTAPQAFLAQVQAIIGSDRSESVRNIKAPTLVIHGTEDALIPVGNGKALASRIPGAKLVLYDDCGHMPMWETPERLSRDVLAFLG